MKREAVRGVLCKEDGTLVKFTEEKTGFTRKEYEEMITACWTSLVVPYDNSHRLITLRFDGLGRAHGRRKNTSAFLKRTLPYFTFYGPVLITAHYQGWHEDMNEEEEKFPLFYFTE